jgi:DNA-directed RNA polymerase subunit M/transcription elongation factor TFIIS
MHEGPVKGDYTSEWKKTEIVNSKFGCALCGSKEVFFRTWESACGGYDDTHYKCIECGHQWWVESDDS